MFVRYPHHGFSELDNLNNILIHTRITTDGDKITKILVASKTNSQRNYVDVSNYFSKVSTVIVTPWTNNQNASNTYITQYTQTTEDLKVMYKSFKFNMNGEVVSHNFSETPDDEGYYGSCVFIIFGVER